MMSGVQSTDFSRAFVKARMNPTKVGTLNAVRSGHHFVNPWLSGEGPTALYFASEQEYEAGKDL